MILALPTLWLVTGLASEPVLLDAGPSTSPVLEGFARLHLEGSDDPRVTWAEAPTSAFDEGEPDPLAMDGLRGGALKIDVPPGTYDLHAIVGHPLEDPQSWLAGSWGLWTTGGNLVTWGPERFRDWLASPGYAAAWRPHGDTGTGWARQVAPATAWMSGTVEVGDDGLVVRPHLRPLRALALVPHDDPSWDVVRATADGAREGWWLTHVAPPVAPDPTTPIAAEDWTDPSPHLGRGDRWSTTVALPDDRPGRWTWSGPGDVEVVELAWHDVHEHPYRAVRWAPVIATPGPAWEGGQGAPVTLRVTVRTRPDDPPGTVAGSLRLTRDDDTLDLPLSFVVHDTPVDDTFGAGLFAQAPPEFQWGMLPHDRLALLDQLLDHLAAAGLDTISLRYASWPVAWTLFGGQQDAGDAAMATLEHVAQAWSDRGGRALIWSDIKTGLRAEAYDDASPTPGRIPADRVLLTIELVEAALDAPLPVWIHAWEEEGLTHTWAQDAAPLFAEQLQAGHARDITTFGTLATPKGWGAERLDVVTVSAPAHLLDDAVTAARPGRQAVWAYNLAPGAVGPLHAWAAGADGLIQWHVNAWVMDPSILATKRPRWFHLLFGPDGRWHDTAQLFDLADGVADARLLDTLARRLHELPPRRHRQAEDLLTAVRTQIAQTARPGRRMDVDPAMRDLWRANALQLLAPSRRAADAPRPR